MSHMPPATELLTGSRVGGYLILRRIGSGGMADVYLAEQQSLGRQVALKVLHPALAHDEAYVSRFQNEARAAASLVHPNIVQIYEVGRADGVHFIAQEFVAGKNLEQILSRHGAFDPGVVLDILRQVTSALCRGADEGIVHRDIKPANILLSATGAVKVADYGLARVLSADNPALTQIGVTMGTPLYMSPEQIEGRPVDVRSDIYSLGAACYHLLCGVPPHTGDTALAIAVGHLNKQPQPLADMRPEVPERLAHVVHRMMAKDPGERFASPADLLSELKFLANEAAHEGWAEGAGQWSVLEWLSSSGSTSAASTELAGLMRDESRLEQPGTRWRSMMLWSVGAFAIGMLLALGSQGRFLLSEPGTVEVPKRDSPGAQLFHAKMVDSEAAWRAVWENFPEADTFYKQLAQQGLVRHYLLVSQQYDRTLPVLRELGEQAGTNESLRAFVLAAEVVCHEKLRHQREAAEAYAQLTPADKDHLHRTEGDLYRLLESSRER